jgi:hypothetical protein
MKTELVKAPKVNGQVITGGAIVPAIIADAGEKAGKRFIEFLTATIRNANTREAYARAIGDFFAWCEGNRLTLTGIEPVHVAAYIENLTKARSAPTVKQHLSRSGSSRSGSSRSGSDRFRSFCGKTSAE